MNLKESYRYQNKFQKLLQEVQNYLYDSSNVTMVTQEHFRSKANAEAVDEKIDATKDKALKFDVNIIGDFAMHLIDLKEELGKAIATAKANAQIDIDTAISNNKSKQYLASVFNRMANIKSTERIATGTGYKFNAEGNQVGYRYEVKEVQTIDFDRNKFKSMARNLLKESDEISNLLDKIEVETTVNFTSPYDVNDSLEDALTLFASQK